ncbi:MAG: tetratricopeptide repeat protein, partial [Rhodospirillaceae bacterium]
MSRAAKTGSIAETLQKAFQAHQAGQLSKAVRLYDAVLKKDPAQGDALNLKGIILQTRERHAEALALFERAAAALPNFPDVPFNMANTLKALERNDEALAAYDKACALNPGYADARLNAGTLLHKLGRTTEAIASFREMVRIAPADPRAHYNLGVCLTESLPSEKEDKRERLIKEAEDAFKRALALNANDANTHYAYANLLSAKGDHDNAIKHTQTAINLNPNWPEALSDLGERLRAADRFDEAINVLRRAASLRPRDSIIQYNLATALSDVEEYSEAERIFLDVIESDPSFVRAYANLGMVYKNTDRRDDAIALYEEALYIEPTLHQAYSNLAFIFRDEGWENASLALFDKALSYRDSDVAIAYHRGATLLRLGRLADGWPFYELRFDKANERIFLRPTPPVYWGGEDLSGKSILVWTEQGLGDEVLHGSMLPDVVARAQTCI